VHPVGFIIRKSITHYSNTCSSFNYSFNSYNFMFIVSLFPVFHWKFYSQFSCYVFLSSPVNFNSRCPCSWKKTIPMLLNFSLSMCAPLHWYIFVLNSPEHISSWEAKTLRPVCNRQVKFRIIYTCVPTRGISLCAKSRFPQFWTSNLCKWVQLRLPHLRPLAPRTQRLKAPQKHS
jgi:hypothetical protein